MPKHETTFWLEKVREDEITISAVMPLKLWNIACYHAQQAAEKYIKSAIVEASLVPPRIHD